MADASFESTSALHQLTLERAIAELRTLLATGSSSHWKPLAGAGAGAGAGSSEKGKGKVAVAVAVHRRKGSRGAPDVVRASTEVGLDSLGLDEWHAVLATPEVRSAWDKLVEHAHDVERIDASTRITKTDYRLGWPASPRDTITIARTLCDAATLIDISTSLPRSADEPAFLRPAPPYVRSSVHLLAWSLQLLPSTPAPRGRLTLHLQWTHKGATPTPTHAAYAALLTALVDQVRSAGPGIPLVKGYGAGIEVASSVFDRQVEMRVVEYCVLPDDLVEWVGDLEQRKERRRLERTVEVSVGEQQGWDVRLGVKGVGEAALGWVVVAERADGRVTLRFKHERIERVDAMVRVSLTVQRLAGGKGVKVNGEAVPIEQRDSRDVASVNPIGEMFDDTATVDSSRTSSISTIDTLPATTDLTATLSLPPPPPLPSNQSATIRSLLRRNYIYFTSLLQEPEAKWRPVSDSHGVTVTQLNSIDPTLTIYRAEATFVGVGVWDVFATVCTPGARAAWDKGFEDAQLIEDVSELSEVWWSKAKGAWPVAPRDSVTLRTAYKSPSSVHIFSFSTDDTSLFPSIPLAYLPTIRTQTSLYGWAIEALSPTTTQITLLDQSDPKGWSNKSWTPTQMIAAVAGVGDFSIKSGGPPVVTRLVGARKVEERYEVDKGSLRVEYRVGARILEGAAGQEWDGAERGRVDDGEQAEIQTLECEIRCDCATWATSIDLVIDPPPSRFSCLSRHRLSSGGGMWITIEHDARTVGDERVLVLVRKGAGGRDKGSVTVNGSKATVDVELLPEDEVKLLAKRKRVKASPIPLDQYSTHGPRVWRTSSVHTNRSGRESPTLSLTATTKNPFDDPTVSSTTLSTSPLNQAPLVPDSPPPPPPAKTKANLPAPAAALEALSWLQTFHAEQGPELADPAPGWAIVAERSGTVVRKKIIPAVSDVLPVYRGDKIVQGLTADEIASVVGAVGCRKQWDERVESALPLASFGHGLSTAVQTTKPAFPFKGRIFHVATVNAHVRVPSASAAASTSTVLFSASASYSPDGSFDAAKTNPTGLLPGQILLEGWILETLDPYTSSMLAIPSTRCTYVSCIDHSGSVPLALNSVLNANLARLIGAVEHLGKSKGPLPRLWTPDSGLQIEGPLSNDGDQECVWKLANATLPTVLLSSDFEIDDGTFRALFHISGPPAPAPAPAPALPPAPHLRNKSSSATLAPPKTTPLIVSSPVGTILKSELPRSASLNFSAPPASPMLQKPSELARKLSSSSLRTAATVPVLERRSRSPPAPGQDLVVAELIIDLKQFPHGYSIMCSSSLTADGLEPLSIEPLRSLAARQVPLRATAHDAPLPPIVSASLDSWKRANHLVRILVPTAAITHPVIDPLRDGVEPKPDWFKKLVEHGALVDVRIVPLPPDVGAKGEAKSRVTFNGETLALGGQKDSRAVLSRMEDEEWLPNCAKISRSAPRKKKSTDSEAPPPELLPPEFAAPLAVAVRLLAPKPVTPLLDDVEFPDPKSPGSSTPNHEDPASRSPTIGTKKLLGASPLNSRREHANSDASANGALMGILGAYPLSRLSSTMTTTTTTTSDSAPPRTQRTYTLTFVLLASLISFLLGSLLRSLLTPADYIIYHPHAPGSEGHHVERALMQAFDPERRWREARRLLEIRSFFFSRWDLIFAAVRQG